MQKARPPGLAAAYMLLPALLPLLSPGLSPWADSTEGVHTFWTFDSGWLAEQLRAPVDPTTASRLRQLDFVWGADQWLLGPLFAASPATRTSKYIPCCRDTSLQEYGDAAVRNYTRKGWGERVLYRCDRRTPAYYAHGGAGLPSHRSLPLDFSNPAVVEWQASQFARPAAALGACPLSHHLHLSYPSCGARGIEGDQCQLPPSADMHIDMRMLTLRRVRQLGARQRPAREQLGCVRGVAHADTVGAAVQRQRE